MTTIVEEDLHPPEAPGPMTWIRQNLFRSWFDAILTVIGVTIILFVGYAIADWIVNKANWAPITEYPFLYLIGQYPRDQMWRIGAMLWGTSFLFGISWGFWGNLLRPFALVLGIFLGALAFFPTSSESYTLNVRLALVANPILIYLGFLLGRRRVISSREILTAWLALFILTVVLLSGVGRDSLLPIQSIALMFGILFLYVGYTVATSLFASGRMVLLVGFALVFAALLGLAIFFVLKQVEAMVLLPTVGTTLWGGLLVTMLLSIVGIVLSFPIGVLLALGRRSSLP
ncbi:MAG TPA: hypothetical protein VJ768_02920, partial [Anaerolineales bacterium]|nr:hypothetical protein [Anaerolineales bacterium]